MKETMVYRRKIAKQMLAFRRRSRARRRLRFSKHDPAELFLFQVLFDQNMDWELAWKNVERFEERIGTLNPRKLAKMPLDKIHRVMKGDKRTNDYEAWISLHRFPKKLAGWVKRASQNLVNDYAGDARKIWNGIRDAKKIESRLRDFSGIGQKKASMAINILANERGYRSIDRSGIDVSVDSLVRRVFLRTGLADKDSTAAIVRAARDLYPKYPGILDLPAWQIGREFCYPRRPECGKCPLSNTCRRKLWRARDEQ